MNATCPLYIDKYRTEYFKKILLLSVIWNALPPSLRLLNSLDSLQKKLQTPFSHIVKNVLNTDMNIIFPPFISIFYLV